MKKDNDFIFSVAISLILISGIILFVLFGGWLSEIIGMIKTLVVISILFIIIGIIILRRIYKNG